MIWQKQVFVFCLMVCLLPGCTSLQPLTGKPADVHRRIASGKVLKPGDSVLVLTDDGRQHYLIVRSVNASTIEGGTESISIDQIASIQKHQLDVGKTALAVGLTVIVAAAAIVVVAAYAVRPRRLSPGRTSRHSARAIRPVPPPPLIIPIQNFSCGTSSDENNGEQGRSDGMRVPPCGK